MTFDIGELKQDDEMKRRLFSSLSMFMLCLQIREELRANGIDVYPQKEFDEDAEDRLINDKIRVSSQ